MFTNCLPVCKYPTRILFIDDDYDFLQNLALTLDDSSAHYLFYVNPLKALNFMRETYQPQSFPDKYIKPVEETALEHHCVDFNIHDLHQEVYNPRRFEEISTVVIDYNMPGMTGVEFCKQIMNPDIQKIILTGVADEQVALDAFNKGIIDGYIRKQDPQSSKILNELIFRSQNRYFQLKSSFFLNIIAQTPTIQSAMLDPVFNEHLQKIISEYKFSEFYLMEAIGSMLLLAPNGDTYGLLIRSIDEMEAWLHEFLSSDGTMRLSEDFIQSLKELRWMPGPFQNFNNTSSEAPNLKPAQKLAGNTSYCYALERDLFQLDKTALYSFGHVRNSQSLEFRI